MEKGKKVIIALWGPQGRGKTTTLRKLALEFLDSPEVEEDIQVGFLYYKENEKKPTKIVVSTTKDPGVNTDFYTALTAQTLILTTTRTNDQTEEINVDADLVKKEKADPEQESVDTELQPKIKDFIASKAKAQEETTTLRQFSLELLKSEVVEGDIQIAFRYKGKRILISTAGDNKEVVDESTRLFDSVGAEILITAISAEIPAEDAPEEPSKRTIRTQLEKYKKSISKDVVVDLKWEPKVCATSEQEQVNEEQAKAIKSIIDQMIIDWEK
jgi:hypothetical protein